MHESSAILKFVMFADDTCLFFAHKDKKVIENILAEELPKVCDWLKANKLSLNVKKIELYGFPQQKRQFGTTTDNFYQWGTCRRSEMRKIPGDFY